MRLVGIPTDVAELWERYYLSLDENGKLTVGMKLSEHDSENKTDIPIFQKHSKKTIH